MDDIPRKRIDAALLLLCLLVGLSFAVVFVALGWRITFIGLFSGCLLTAVVFISTIPLSEER